MEKIITNKNGITLVVLTITIVVLLIITTTVINLSTNNLKTKNLSNMYTDIKSLEDKISVYYNKYGTLPLKEKYTGETNFNVVANPNDDTEGYYIIDIQKLSNLVLTRKLTWKNNDAYIINTKTHTIYYPKGVELDGETFYRLPGEYSKIIVYEDEFDSENLVNKPVIVDGMIPVYYENGVWKKADSTNKDETKKWYNYTEKRWANIATVESKNLSKYQNAELGTEIVQSEITTMFVWIPRYSYEIDSSNQKINISFLQGTTNKEADGEETKKIVHPVFTDGSKNNYAEGGWNKELPGFWVAKFEASGIENGTFVGNGSASSNSQIQAPTANTAVRVIPSAISWRYITVGESQYRSRQMSKNTASYGWTSGTVDTHLIKNDEWGAVAYLCYSKYGNVPMTNKCGNKGNTGTYYYNLYTGMGPYSNEEESTIYEYDTTHIYATELGTKASTTGNVYGIYDMVGGNWERVAGYLNNGNYYLGYNGYSTTDTSIKYFSETAQTENTATLLDNPKYWCKYEVGNEEKNNAITVGNNTLTQWALWDTSKNTKEYNATRLRITTETYNKIALCRGIGINEVTNEFSYYGAYNNGTTNSWGIFTDTTQPDDKKQTYAKAWGDDLILIGHSSRNFLIRGGSIRNSYLSGMFGLDCTFGTAYYDSGFRPTLVI